MATSGFRSACEALANSSDEVSALTVLCEIPHDAVVTDVMDEVERLARAHRFVARIALRGREIEVRFERAGAASA